MGTKLIDADEYMHAAGPEINWNESRYVDFWDPSQRVGGWFRIGVRPNARYAEMSACVYLPDGRTAFTFGRPEVDGNTLTAGDQVWGVSDPWRLNTLRYHGPLMVLDDTWMLTDPKRAFSTAERVDAEIDLECYSTGLAHVMGSDQDHIDKIFLPGQAALHYQHLARSTGRVRVGQNTWQVDGRGGKDHSWGPRNWHAKIYLRWLICAVDDQNGFMLVRAVGPNKQTRSGYVLDDGKFHVVDDFEMRNRYCGAPHHQLEQVDLVIHSGARRWTATGIPLYWLPLRHRQKNERGEDALLRIVKSPAQWRLGDGREGTGHCEYHDLMVDDKPVGLAD